MATVYETLAKVQSEIAVPKSRTNKFGGYSYRNAEDIMEAVKPACQKHGAAFFVSDSIEFVEGRFYVVATATFAADGQEIKAKGYARECDSKKGMDEAQITGSASSYARKYALCGLFGIDGQDDPDAMDNREKKDERRNATRDQMDAIHDVANSLDTVCGKTAAQWISAALESNAAKEAGVKPGNELTDRQAGEVLGQLRVWADKMAAEIEAKSLAEEDIPF